MFSRKPKTAPKPPAPATPAPSGNPPASGNLAATGTHNQTTNVASQGNFTTGTADVASPQPFDMAAAIDKFNKSLVEPENIMKAIQKDRSKFRKIASSSVKKFLEPATQICSILDGLASTYPPAGIVSKSLMVVLKMERDRRENDARILIIFSKFASALLVLSQLELHFKPDLMYQQQLEDELSKFDKLFHDFANFSDIYYSHKVRVIYHLIHSNSEKEKLSEFIEEIEARKTELTSLVIRQTSKDASVIRATTTQTAVKVDALVKFFVGEPADDDERRAQEFFRSNGGEDAVQQNPELLSKFAKTFHQQVTDGLTKTVQESLDDAMIRNRDLFDLRFITVQQQLKEAVEVSSAMILAEIRDGAYARIENEEIRDIWKGVTKSANVKRRPFIAALADHYNLVFKKHYLDNHTEHPDAWTLHFLTKVAYHPAIGDAIDEDGSGYISVSEMNKFLSHKGNFSIPEWFAYWAHGWLNEISESANDIGVKIFQLKKKKEEWVNKIKAELIEERKEELSDADIAVSIQPYLEQVEKISQLNVNQPRSLPEPQKSKLDVLCTARRKILEDTMRLKLASKLKYTIVDSTSIDILLENQPIESVLMILLPLLLRHHLKAFQDALTSPLLLWTMIDDMTRSLEVITEGIAERIEELRDAWRQNRLELDYQFRHFGGGLFEQLWVEIKKKDTSETDYEYLYLIGEWDDGYSDDEDDVEPATENSVPMRKDNSSSLPAASRGPAAYDTAPVPRQQPGTPYEQAVETSPTYSRQPTASRRPYQPQAPYGQTIEQNPTFSRKGTDFTRSDDGDEGSDSFNNRTGYGQGTGYQANKDAPRDGYRVNNLGTRGRTYAAHEEYRGDDGNGGDEGDGEIDGGDEDAAMHERTIDDQGDEPEDEQQDYDQGGQIGTAMENDEVGEEEDGPNEDRENDDDDY